MPFKNKRGKKEASSWEQSAKRTRESQLGAPAHHYSFKEGFPLFTWLPKLETVAHPLLKAVLHVPYVRAAVPFPNRKWLGHVCTDWYILCIHTL